MKLKSLAMFIALVTGLLGFVSTAQAGYSRYTICYMQTHGVTKCQYLPSNYRISGVRKPYCNRRHFCRNGRVGLRLSRRVIRCLSRYTNTDSMAPMAYATIYAKVR